uniref:Uncharacterized protein n=1 Tax=Arundo donax TaxID=35708 RepID=A0A0A9DR36_ARUDO
MTKERENKEQISTACVHRACIYPEMLHLPIISFRQLVKQIEENKKRQNVTLQVHAHIGSSYGVLKL